MNGEPRAPAPAPTASAVHYGLAVVVVLVQGLVLYWVAGQIVRAVSRGPRIVMRDLSRGVLIREGVTPDAPELVVDPFPDEPYTVPSGEGDIKADAMQSLSKPADGDRIVPQLGWAKPTANEFRVDRKGGIDNCAALGKFLQGSEKRELDNPPTFLVSARGTCKLGMMVSKVNNWAGARLEFVLDGKTVPLPALNSKPGNETVDKLFELEIPKGEHRITVRNAGKDWASVAWYKFSGMLGD